MREFFSCSCDAVAADLPMKDLSGDRPAMARILARIAGFDEDGRRFYYEGCEMIRTLSWTIAAVLGLFLSGCVGTSTTVIGPDGLARHVSAVQTSLTPKESLRRTSTVFERLELQRVKPPGYTPPGGGGIFSSEPKDWPIASDAFSGDVRARTAAGEAIDAYATWEGQGKTTIKVTTQLIQSQHEHLVEMIDQQLNGAPIK